MPHSQSNDLSTKRVLNINELCQYTGLAKGYVYKLTHWRKIPFSRPGGKLLYFDREKIEKWLLSNPAMTAEESDIVAATHVMTSA